MNESTDQLASTRTILAADRTLMAWIRTAMSMISFGLTIYKFLHGLSEAGGIRLSRPGEPRSLGLFLTALGTGSIVAGLLEYMQTLHQVTGRRRHLGSVFYVACLVLVLGALVLVELLTRRGPL